MWSLSCMWRFKHDDCHSLQSCDFFFFLPLAVGSSPLSVRLSVMLLILIVIAVRDTDKLAILKISWMRSKWTDFSTEGRAITACESADDKLQDKWWRGTQVAAVKKMELMRTYGLCVHQNLNVVICEFILKFHPKMKICIKLTVLWSRDLWVCKKTDTLFGCFKMLLPIKITVLYKIVQWISTLRSKFSADFVWTFPSTHWSSAVMCLY